MGALKEPLKYVSKNLICFFGGLNEKKKEDKAA